MTIDEDKKKSLEDVNTAIKIIRDEVKACRKKILNLSGDSLQDEKQIGADVLEEIDLCTKEIESLANEVFCYFTKKLDIPKSMSNEQFSKLVSKIAKSISYCQDSLKDTISKLITSIKKEFNFDERAAAHS